MSWVKRASIEPTDLCNLKCPFCPRDYYEKHVVNPSKRAWNISQGSHVLEELARYCPNLKRVTFGLFGEPTLNPALPTLLKVAKGLGFTTRISTNAIALDKSFIDEIRNYLDVCNISAYGYDHDSYWAMHGSPMWHRIEKNLPHIINARWRYGWKLTTYPVMCEEAKPYLHGITNFWQPKMDYFGWSPEIMRSGLEERLDPWDHTGKPHCVDQIAITVRGGVAPCCNHNFDEYLYGNIFEDNLVSILDGVPRMLLSDRLASGQDLPPTCANCRYAHQFKGIT